MKRKKLDDYTGNAESCRELLLEKLQEARKEAESNVMAAKRALDVRQDLISLVDGVESLDATLAASLVESYKNMLSLARPSGKQLLQGLTSAVEKFRLPPEQAAQVVKAIMTHIRGEVHAGFISWPEPTTWPDLLHNQALRQWASWADPAGFKKILQREAKASEDYFEAEKALIQLERARHALEEIVLKSANEVKIKNTTPRRVGLSGILSIDANSERTLTANDYVQLLNHNGFNNLRANGTLEVVA